MRLDFSSLSASNPLDSTPMITYQTYFDHILFLHPFLELLLFEYFNLDLPDLLLVYDLMVEQPFVIFNTYLWSENRVISRSVLLLVFVSFAFSIENCTLPSEFIITSEFCRAFLTSFLNISEFEVTSFYCISGSK